MNTDLENQTQRYTATDTNLLSEISNRYFPFWPVFILITGFTLAGAFFYLRYQIPVYQVSAQILLKDSKKGVEDSKLLDDLNHGDEKKIIENETVILSSWPLMKEVIKKLNLYTIQYKKEQYGEVELYGISAPVTIVATDKEAVHPVSQPIAISLHWKNRTYTFLNKTHRLGDTINVNNTSYIISANVDYINLNDKPEERILVRILNPSQLAVSLAKTIAIEPSVKLATVLSVSMPAENRAKVTDVINTLFKVYNDASQSDKNRIAQRTLEFVNERLGLVTKDLEKVEDNVKDYKTSAGIVDISEQGRLFLSSVQANDVKLSELNEQLSVLDEVEMYVNGKGSNTGTVPSLIGIPDGTLASLLNKLYETEIELERLSKVTGRQNDQQTQLRGVIATLKPDILENIRNIRKNFVTAKNNLNKSILESHGVLKAIPGKEKGLIEISRQQNIKNSIYSFLLQKREETALSYASEVPDMKVISPAQAGSLPLAPVPTVIYFSALAAGILLSALLIFMLETASSKVLFRVEIEQKVKAPIIGELIYDRKHTPLVLTEGKRDLLSEQFRNVRANLAYLGSNGSYKVVQVCSSISGEGKSYVSSNLAIALSITGKKVLLMDMDLRKPKIHTIFDLARENGTTDYLTAKSTFDDVMKQAPDYKNLSILTSGTLLPTPSELISNDTFDSLMKLVKERFDYIVFDTPPVSLVSDSLLLAKYSDTTIYVVRHDYTKKLYLKFIQQLEREHRFNNMGILFNGLKPRGFISGGGNGFGNGVGYGNGYGSEYSNGYGDYVNQEV